MAESGHCSVTFLAYLLGPEAVRPAGPDSQSEGQHMGNHVNKNWGRRLAGSVGIAFVLASPLVAGAAGIPIDETRGGIPTLAPILEQRAPGVVNIAVSGTAQLQARGGGQPQQRRVQGQGSGVIVDAQNGYILTNHHVVANASTITITLNDGRSVQANKIGSDEATDIAVLKLANTEKITAVPFGSPDQLKVGDFVIAIGNPYGLGQTVTSGIISALGRGPGFGEGYEDFIQTDASINPGNSGGALIDMQGRLIGINSAIIGPAGGNVGIGFAVPVDMARAVMDQLIKYGDIKRGKIGVSIEDVALDEAGRLGAAGVKVRGVEAGSAAEKAGLAVNDVIVTFNGTNVRSTRDLINKVGLTRAGNTVQLSVLRNGRRQNVEVKVSEAIAAL